MKREYDFSTGERGRFFRKGAATILPRTDKKLDWIGPTGQIGKFVVAEAQKTLRSYRAQPRRITEDANGEHFTAHGGYAHRQLFELVQNSADALFAAPQGQSILVRLTERFLYCADDGQPIEQQGVTALMFSHMSPKRDPGQIGKFGLGFKSVLGVSDAPEFYSRSGSFRFDKRCSAERIAAASVEPAERYPVLRLPEPIDPHQAGSEDEDLRELMQWATNIVRLPLKEAVNDDLRRQIQEFPPEFLLFVDHVGYLTLEDGEDSRDFILRKWKNDSLRLDTGEEATLWRRFKTIHRLSADARSDRPALVDSGEVPIWWAAPIDGTVDVRQFWAYSPTQTASLVGGILNAPWKTNEDRQNLLPGPYNQELIEAAAEMVAGALPKLAKPEDPAAHLDALPRRRESGDREEADLLRTSLFEHLRGSEVIPDQNCILRKIEDISYPPKILTDRGESAPFDRWAACGDRPPNWLHHSAITRNRRLRLATIDRLFPPRWTGDTGQSAPRKMVADWLEALVYGKEGRDAIQASMAAIQVAGLIPDEMRKRDNLGKIVLTAGGALQNADPESLFLPDEPLRDGASLSQDSYVHLELVSDPDTLSSLKALGFRTPSPERRFRLIASQVLQSEGGEEADEDLHHQFWANSRKLPAEAAEAIIRERKNWDRREVWPTKLRVRTRKGTWQAMHAVLLPGIVVPGDGSRDDGATLDTQFHAPDEELLHTLGVTDAPRSDGDLSVEPEYVSFLGSCRQRYSKRDDLPHHPQKSSLNFVSNKGAGPLEILSVLSDEGRWRYTDALLRLDACYERWRMRHKNWRKYPEAAFDSLTIHMLRKHGRVRTARGVVPLVDALGPSPRSQAALNELLVHPMADKIKATFDLVEPTPELFGKGDRTPLTDVWPGLMDFLPSNRKQCCLVSCERILVAGQAKECVFHAPDIYLVGGVDDEKQRKLKLIADELKLGLDSNQIEAIVQRRTPHEVEKRRAAIRQCSSDAERLLRAVGEKKLRRDLPHSLLAVLESNGAILSGTEIAEAAVATYHTDTLKRYGWALEGLDPPSRWAGSKRAVEFVRSLGFPAEWAGERSTKRAPFMEVSGPRSLPALHGYQRTIVDNVRNMLCEAHGNGAERRGMISMPTGSGKTRVAVQAIVEAMRDDGFRGGVLWVADRDELCEQAVESWKQVWSSVGSEAVQLRISRMWEGQPAPMPTSDFHVVVATIQTLNARLDNQGGEYEFLADFKLVVFDEAHRSIAPSFTSAMAEIGLTRFQRPDEPFMLGLTATPYRGHDEDETKRLVGRYGNTRLDSGAFGCDEPEAVVGELQDIGVLAQADHETIEGETFPLDSILDGSFDEPRVKQILAEWRALPWLPEAVEQHIARSPARTKRIVEAYEQHVSPDWPTLIFATSVEHARTLAALLNRKGIPSRSVSAETARTTRRRIVEEFRCGELKALVNHGVFREGFDAPKTRAIIVARPVYSPNLYFQMIGRGLRGPLNGGEDRCLILNVRDNIENFDRALAFSELDWLWA